MNFADKLEALRLAARRDPKLRGELLASRETEDPLRTFCLVSCRHGFDISPYEMVMAGEEAYAAMRRSTNGGGENHAFLEWEDDYYELLMAELEALEEKKEKINLVQKHRF